MLEEIVPRDQLMIIINYLVIGIAYEKAANQKIISFGKTVSSILQTT